MTKVKIIVKETVIYNQEVEITEEEYQELIKLNDIDLLEHEDGYHQIMDLIDRSDVFDTTGEIRDAEIVKIT